MNWEECGIYLNTSRTRLTGHVGLDMQLRNNFFVPSVELVILTFMHLNYREVFIKEISLLLTLEIDVIKSEKASETKNIHGNITQIHRVIQIGMANNFMDQM